MNTQWVLADGNDLRMVEVSYEYECYFERKNEAYGFVEDFMGRMRVVRPASGQGGPHSENAGLRRAGMRRVRESAPPSMATIPRAHSTGSGSTCKPGCPRRIERHRPDYGFEFTWISDARAETHDHHPRSISVSRQGAGGPVHSRQFPPAMSMPIRTISGHGRDQQVKGEMVYAEVPKGLKERPSPP